MTNAVATQRAGDASENRESIFKGDKKMSKWEKIKELQSTSGLSLPLCKQVMDEVEYDMDRALSRLKKHGHIKSISKEEIIERCLSLANEWAADFLSSTRESGELRECCEENDVYTIQDNWYRWHVIGHPDTDWHLIFRNDLKFISDEESDALEDEIRELYDRAVERLLPEYLK